MLKIINPDILVNARTDTEKVTQYGSAVVQAAITLIGISNKTSPEYQELKTFFDEFSIKLKQAVDDLGTLVGNQVG